MKNFTLKIFVFSVISLVIIFGGCSRKNQNQSAGKKSFTIKGSDTMVQLMSLLAESYMKQNPDAQVSVTGGGSGTGIAALLNGSTDICASSRDMQEKELKDASTRNIDFKEYIIAYDGLAVIVHPNNPVNELTLEQVKKIYTGVYTNWKDIGGTDGKIDLYSRENSSGTFVFFQEHVLDKEDFAKETKLLPATSAIIQSITEDKLAIGYSGLGYTRGSNVKILGIKKDENSPAVLPSIETVHNKTYSIARPLYLFFNGEPKNEIKKFLDFCLSAEGQKIVDEAGYITIN